MTVVLITGALTGIGRATALAFAREGDQIVVSGRHGEAGEELAQELRARGAEAEFICADVRHDDEMCRRTIPASLWTILPEESAQRAIDLYPIACSPTPHLPMLA
jgi:NAD(P)-dependent dehydrogenase (short-subunit alcohol dehydrogenase family)